eukprot:SAG31_NODE_40215_length_282_cov_0.846995_1_plen_47_part_10
MSESTSGLCIVRSVGASGCLRRPEFKTGTPEVLEITGRFGVPNLSPG